MEKDGKLLMGWRYATLLERIDQPGSTSAMAHSMKLAYLWVEAINRLSGKPLVEKSTGERHGGHASLTDEERRIVREYKAKRACIKDVIDR